MAVQDVLEVTEGSLSRGERVVIVDDLLATGGSLKAAVQLVTDSLAVPVACLVLVELGALKGADVLPVPVFSVLRT